jgi:uncharacterized protein YktB (UPF0637 family)
MMTEQNQPAVLTLDQVEEAAEFGGFTPEDFEVFENADSAERIPQLHMRINPKLECIGDVMKSRLPEALDEAVYPHVVRQNRRAVNAGEEAWVAFSRSPNAYKPFVHLRLAVSADHVRIMVVVEAGADERPLFALNLERNAEPLSLYMTHHPTILAFALHDSNGEPLRGHALNGEVLCALAQRMNRVKRQVAAFGIAFAKTHPVLQSGPQLMDAIVEAARALRPLYDCGKPDFTYTYTPEVVKGV